MIPSAEMSIHDRLDDIYSSGQSVLQDYMREREIAARQVYFELCPYVLQCGRWPSHSVVGHGCIPHEKSGKTSHLSSPVR